MARQYGKILTSIWGDDEFKKLTGETQRVYFLLLSQPELTMCGVLTPAPARWSTMCDKGTVKAVRAALVTLEQKKFTVSDDTTDEMWIRSFVHHDLNLQIPNVWVGMSNAWVSIASASIRAQFLDELHKRFPEGMPKALDKQEDCDRLAKGFLKGFLNA